MKAICGARAVLPGRVVKDAVILYENGKIAMTMLGTDDFRPSADNPRKRALLNVLRGGSIPLDIGK